MAVKREYKCLAHGFFEAVTEDGETPRCPSGCNFGIERAFLTPTSIRGTSRTKNIDRTFAQMAQDFNLSDISNRGGESVMHNNLKNNPISREAREFKPQWHALPKAGQGGEVDIGGFMQQHGVANSDPGALQAGAFKPVSMIPNPQLTFGDASMLAGAVAEGQKASK